MQFRLSGHFTYRRLLRFVISPILMMICTSIYGVIDGFFVSNFIGKTAFAAVNLMMPVYLVAVAIGFMIGEGGNAIISKTLGEGNRILANQYFSLLVYVSSFIGLLLSIGGWLFIPQIAAGLGAHGELSRYCITYGRIILASQCFYVLQNVFQSFFIASGKPDLSLKVAIAAGLTNALLDLIFIVVLQWGIVGAAWATALGQMAGSLIPLFYFMHRNSSFLRLTSTPLYPKILLKTFTNGSSDMVSVLSGSVVSIIYNYQLMAFAGENGLAAYGAMMYVNFIFMSIFLGYASGSAPLISFQHGAKNYPELHNLFKKSLILVSAAGIIITLIAEISAYPILKMFVGYDQELLLMSVHGFRIYSVAFLFMGLNIWGTAFFTALNNGLISAAISFLRTFGFELAAILLLPRWLGIDGVWSAIFTAEFCSVLVTACFIIKKRSYYRY